MKPKSKKAFTLVEMIVSLALIALVSIMLLGILVPAANLQGAAEKRSIGLNNAAQPLEREVPAATAGANLSPTPSYSFNLGGGLSCTGTLYKSTDSNSKITLYEFVPDP